MGKVKLLNLHVGIRLFIASAILWLGIFTGHQLAAMVLAAIAMKIPNPFTRRSWRLNGYLHDGGELTTEQEAAQKEFLDKIKDQNEKQLAPLRKTIETQGIELTRLKGGKNFSTGTPLVDIIKAKQKEIENFLTGNARSVKITVPHTVLKTLAATTSITDSTQGYRLPDVGQIATAPLTLRSLFRSVDIGENSGGVVKYLDQSEVTRGAAAKAEGAEKGESAIEWTERSLPIRKIPDTIPVTKELLTDFAQLARDIEQFLLTNVSLKVEDQLWDGDGNAPNLKGLYTSAEVWGGYSGPAIEAANIFDLLTIIRAGLIAEKGGKYSPDFVAINPEDLAALRVTKGNDEQYLLPALASTIAGMRLIESAEVPQGKLLIGDSRFGTIYTIGGGVEIELGYVNNQFRENKITVLAEERLALLIREVDADGFLKIDSIEMALEELESPSS